MPKGYNIEDYIKIILLRIYFARNVETYLGPHPNCPICLSHFNKIRIFLTLLQKSPSIKLHWTYSVGAALLLADRQTDRATDGLT